MIEKLHLMTLMFLGGLKAERDDRGATAVEYGLLVALIAAVIIGTVATLGGEINTAFTTISNRLP